MSGELIGNEVAALYAIEQPIALVIFDIDGVVRDVGNSYRRALADTVEQFTQGAYRPSQEDIDALKVEGIWNNDWEASQEMVYRYFDQQGKSRDVLKLDYTEMVGFFQRRYRGENPADPDTWNGYICQEPLLMSAAYLEKLTQAGIAWGFFSGATRGSASYVLERRLGLRSPTLIAMEDAPGKPDPTGLFATVQQIETQLNSNNIPVVYVGDTVADMQTVMNAQKIQPDRQWVGIGVLPPHAQQPMEYAKEYGDRLHSSGAIQVLNSVEQLTPDVIRQHITG